MDYILQVLINNGMDPKRAEVVARDIKRGGDSVMPNERAAAGRVVEQGMTNLADRVVSDQGKMAKDATQLKSVYAKIKAGEGLTPAEYEVYKGAKQAAAMEQAQMEQTRLDAGRQMQSQRMAPPVQMPATQGGKPVMPTVKMPLYNQNGTVLQGGSGFSSAPAGRSPSVTPLPDEAGTPTMENGRLITAWEQQQRARRGY